MKIEKIRDVKTPERGTQWSAGIDFFVPNDFKTITLKPNEDINIPSGIKCQIPHGYALLGVNKSGVSLNKKLQVGACLVDEDYTGELHLHVFNCGRKNVEIKAGDKLVQFILTPIFYDEIEVTKLKVKQTQRGEGGFGSTNEEKIDSLNDLPQDILPKLNRVTAYVVAVDQAKQSKHGGSYRRHYFRDVHNPQITYILDVTWASKNIFKFINKGDVLTNLIVFSQGKKHFINGKSSAVNVGKWEQIKKHFIKELKGIKLN